MSTPSDDSLMVAVQDDDLEQLGVRRRGGGRRREPRPEFTFKTVNGDIRVGKGP